MSEPVSYQRYIPREGLLDWFSKPANGDTLFLIMPVWIKRLNLGEYTKIEVRLKNGQLVTFKRKPQ